MRHYRRHYRIRTEAGWYVARDGHLTDSLKDAAVYAVVDGQEPVLQPGDVIEWLAEDEENRRRGAPLLPGIS